MPVTRCLPLHYADAQTGAGEQPEDATCENDAETAPAKANGRLNGTEFHPRAQPTNSVDQMYCILPQVVESALVDDGDEEAKGCNHEDDGLEQRHENQGQGREEEVESPVALRAEADYDLGRRPTVQACSSRR